MINLSPEIASRFESELAAFAASTGAAPGSFSRLQEGIRIASGASSRLPPDPLQGPAFYIPGLRSLNFWEPAQFEWVSRLESASNMIRAELLALRGHSLFGREPEAELVERGTWAQFDFYVAGKKVPANCAKCPETTAILESIEEARHSDLMLFSANVPGTHVKPHCGPHNARLRCHMGLICPEGCEIRVGSEVRAWTEGKCMVFDDSFEHEVWNRSNGTRVVLLLDVWHPDLTEMEKMAIRYFMQPLMKAVLDPNNKEALNRWEFVQDPNRAPLPPQWWV